MEKVVDCIELPCPHLPQKFSAVKQLKFNAAENAVVAAAGINGLMAARSGKGGFHGNGGRSGDN